MVSVRNLTFSYNDSTIPALKDIDINIAKGEFVGITGPTGAGKSTLTLCLNGIIPNFQEGTFSGYVTVDGKDTLEHSCADLACIIGSVFQDPEAQLVSSTVEDEIAFGLENLNYPYEDIKQRIDESLELTGISRLRKHSTVRLSGGQKQRVAIASAIALRPKILVLDEPTSELDPQGSYDVFNILFRLNKDYGITIIIAEQKMQLLCEFCTRLVVLDKGSIILDGTPHSVAARQDIMCGLGIDIPPYAKLAGMLKNNGFNISTFPVGIEEAYSAVSKILGGRRQQPEMEAAIND